MAINPRLKLIQDIDLFLNDKNKILESVLCDLGWNKNSLQDEVKVQCPVDPGHWVVESSLSQHKDTCEWVKDGFSKEEKEKLPPSSSFFYENSSSVIPIVIDKEMQGKILEEKGLIKIGHSGELLDVPRSIDRWSVDLNTEQRLAVYDYIVETSKMVNPPQNVALDDLMINFENKGDQDSKPKSNLELLAEQRDYKRRRQSYRAKNVHITKKSYTEVMKEVIENQITYLAETRKQENNDESDPEVTSRRSDGELSLSDSERHTSSRHQRSHRHRFPTPKRSKKHKHDRDRSSSKSKKHKKHHKHKSHKSSKYD